MYWIADFFKKKPIKNRSDIRQSTLDQGKKLNTGSFAGELKQYILDRKDMAQGDDNHHKYNFFCIGLGFKAKDKITAAQKMIDAIEGRNVNFTLRDVRALENRSLGKIVSEYAALNCLPDRFKEDKSKFEKEINAAVERIETRALFKM